MEIVASGEHLLTREELEKEIGGLQENALQPQVQQNTAEELVNTLHWRACCLLRL